MSKYYIVELELLYWCYCFYVAFIIWYRFGFFSFWYFFVLIWYHFGFFFWYISDLPLFILALFLFNRFFIVSIAITIGLAAQKAWEQKGFKDNFLCAFVIFVQFLFYIQIFHSLRRVIILILFEFFLVYFCSMIHFLYSFDLCLVFDLFFCILLVYISFPIHF